MPEIWRALGDAGLQLVSATLTLLPGPIAYFVYGFYLKQQPPLSSFGRWRRYWRLSVQITGGLLAAFIIAYGFGQTCAQDDAGYCLDSDWSAPTSAEMLKNFVRLSLLIVGALAFAYDKRRKDPEWPRA